MERLKLCKPTTINYFFLIREKLAKKGNGKSPILNIFYGSAPYYFNDPNDKLVTWQLEPTKEKFTWRFSVHLSGPYKLCAFGRLKSGAIVYDTKCGIIETPNPNTNHQKNVRNKTLQYQAEHNHRLYAVDIIHSPNNAIVYPIRSKIINNNNNKIKSEDFRSNTATTATTTTFINTNAANATIEPYKLTKPQDEYLLPLLEDYETDYTNYEEYGRPSGISAILERSPPPPLLFNNTAPTFFNDHNVYNDFQGKVNFANQIPEYDLDIDCNVPIIRQYSDYTHVNNMPPAIDFENIEIEELAFDNMVGNYNELVEDGMESVHHCTPVIKDRKMYCFDNICPTAIKKISNRKTRSLNNVDVRQRYLNNT